MTQADRQALAARLQREQAVRFEGVAKRAYVAAGVNSATWTRVTSGDTIKPHIQHKIIAALWPETHGDWTQIPDEGSRLATPRRVTPANVDQILDRLDALEARIDDLDKRVPNPGPNLSAVAFKDEVEKYTEFDD